jgi:hypothetical protein
MVHPVTKNTGLFQTNHSIAMTNSSAFSNKQRLSMVALSTFFLASSASKPVTGASPHVEILAPHSLAHQIELDYTQPCTECDPCFVDTVGEAA